MIRSKSTAHKRSGSHIARDGPQFGFVVKDSLELDERDRVNSKQTYRKELGCLYSNKGNMRPELYSSLKYTVLPSVKLRREVPDSHAKQIVYRSLFKNCYSNMEDRRFSDKLSLFHDYFVELCNSAYPFTMLKTEFPEYLSAKCPTIPNASAPVSKAYPVMPALSHKQAGLTKSKQLAKNPTQPRLNKLRHPSNLKAISKAQL